MRFLDVAAVSATAGAFALYARVESPWHLLGWIGLVPWLARLDRQTSVGGALWIGWLQSVAFTLAVFAWFAPAVASYTGVPAWGTAVLLAIAAPLLQPQFLVASACRHMARPRGPAFGALAGSLAYVATEGFFPKLFGDTLGHGLFASVMLRQGADLAGAPGLTLILLLANEGVCTALHRPHPARALRSRYAALAIALGLPGLLFTYGTIRHHALTEGESGAPPVRAIAVQAALGSYDLLREEIGAYDTVRRILDVHEGLTRDALVRHGADLVVWPETVYPTTFGVPKSEEGAAFDQEIRAFVDETGVPLLFGAYDAEGPFEYNAAFLLEPFRSEAAGTYRKSRLFPLTERVPAWLEGDAIRARLPWLGTWTAGGGAMVLPAVLRGGRRVAIAPLICLDAVDARLAIDAVKLGAEALVVISNDGWFADGAGRRLHLVVSAFRSLETRRPQLRVTNDGISAVISPTGELRQVSAVGERAAQSVSFVPVREGSTLMLAWGDWLAGVALVATAGLLAWARLARRRFIE